MLKFVVSPSRLLAGAFVAAIASSDQITGKRRLNGEGSLRAQEVSSVLKYKAQMQADKQKCYLEVYVTDTNERNGPGHVSTSMLRERRDGAFEVAAHTSYMPIEGGGFVNAPLLGTIPVPAKNFSVEEIREYDVENANRILRIPISEEALERGVAKQEEIARAVQDGRYFYSVTGSANGITRGLAGLMWGYHVSNKAFLRHEQEQGFTPHVDPNDMLLLLVQTEVEGPVDVLNCTSAAEEVIRATTCCDALKGNVLPSVLGEKVSQLIEDAEDVDQSLLAYSQKSSKEDSEHHRNSGLLEY